MRDIPADYLQDSILQFHRLKDLADGAMSQVSHDDFLRPSPAGSNSIAIIVKHVAGNMRSRWTDFLTTDGEKPDRNRDTEFATDKEDSRVLLMKRWEAGWRTLFDALNTLKADDLHRTIHIRGEPHSVVEAINRQMTHYAYHVGQIVYLAKIHEGSDWKPLSIPTGKSKQFNESMREKFSDF